jgi:hypothetical protein
MIQWHPLFAELLRPLVEGHYEVQTDVPVGDVPRQADLVLVRRTSRRPPPFQGLWRWLTEWNILEFKGPSVSARVGDIDRLIELGLGIRRRLAEDRRKQRQARAPRPEVSYWYLANHLGRRFLREAETLLGGLEAIGPGQWRAPHLGRWLVLVSNREVPVDRDSLPVHVLGREPLETAREVAQTAMAQADLWPIYSRWLATLFPPLWEELLDMARRMGRDPVIDLRPVVDRLGLSEVIRQVGPRRVIEHLGMQEIMAEMGLDWLLAQMTPAQRRNLKRLLQDNGKRQ